MKHILLLITLIGFTLTAHADKTRKSPGLNGAASAGPFYNPHSKSYFELFELPRSTYTEWKNAKEAAEGKFYKSTQGRLAVIKDLQTHHFIMQKFHFLNFWIGLRYFCNERSLVWIDGSVSKKSEFSAWDYQWSNTNIRCEGVGYMPVHYTTDNNLKTPRWRASGPHKGYRWYLVEYPTGQQ